MRSIQWNEKAQRVLSPLQRDAFERGEMPRRFDGRLSTDEHGNVWLRAGDHVKLLGTGATPTLADRQPDDGSCATRDLDAPPATSAKRARKPAAKRKRK